MSEAASSLVTIMFTDLVGSTELLSRSGDEDAQRIFRAHHDLLADVAAAHRGEEVKWLGDGLMVAFPSAADAVRAAVAMQQGSRRRVGREQLAIRVGLNAGEALRDAADWFGTPVVVARRLCDLADAGQIICSAVVASLLEGRSGFAFSDLGDLDLKGVPKPSICCPSTTTGVPASWAGSGSCWPGPWPMTRPPRWRRRRVTPSPNRKARPPPASTWPTPPTYAQWRAG